MRSNTFTDLAYRDSLPKCAFWDLKNLLVQTKKKPTMYKLFLGKVYNEFPRLPKRLPHVTTIYQNKEEASYINLLSSSYGE